MINVLLFAQLQETVGKNELKIDAVGKTLQELKEILNEEYQLKNLNQAMIAVNEEYVDKETVLKENDTVAFIPPVSGG